MVEERVQYNAMQGGRITKRFSLATRTGKIDFACKSSFKDTLVSKNIEKAYNLVALLQGGRDLVEASVRCCTGLSCSTKLGAFVDFI